MLDNLSLRALLVSVCSCIAQIQWLCLQWQIQIGPRGHRPQTRAILVLELILVLVFILYSFLSLSDLISDTHAFQVTAACYCVGHYRECHTQKKYALHKPVMLVRIQNPLQQEPASCKQSTSVSKIKWQLLEPYQMSAGRNSSRFRTHRTKCNNSSFRFRFRYENSSAGIIWSGHYITSTAAASEVTDWENQDS